MSLNQAQLIERMPVHLQPFTTVQNYEQYSPRDHAVWRFLLRALASRLKSTAHPVYLEGLARTGISLDAIPSMDAMNEKLADIGWSAVVVDGVIPPAIFMEFQALRILPIALDMRSVHHMLYTPAPDIVHEAAGHAPFLVDMDYAEYLQRMGEVGVKALTTQQDYEVYEAVRHLSIIKERGTASDQDIASAQAVLEQKLAQSNGVSEAHLLSRLHWWTVEYGLVGSVAEYKLFGAGLLSSLGESINCLDDKQVKKIPLSLNAINYPYDITCEQPRLFVTRSCKHLTQVLEAFVAGMACRRGGAAGVQRAIDCKAVSTIEYSTGLQVSGLISTLLTDAVGSEIYIGSSGPSQLAYRDVELPGHGITFHRDGFGSPVGQVKDLPHCLSGYTVDELRDLGIACGQFVSLEFVSGITVAGSLKSILRRDHKNLLFTFNDCQVSTETGETLFQPEWGAFDMAVGEKITSVYGGTADKAQYPLYTRVASEKMPRPAYSAQDLALFELYQSVRDVRNAGELAGSYDLKRLYKVAARLADYPDEWLLRYEILTLMPETDACYGQLFDQLKALRTHSPDYARLIDIGFDSVAAA